MTLEGAFTLLFVIGFVVKVFLEAREECRKG